MILFLNLSELTTIFNAVTRYNENHEHKDVK